MNNWGRGYIRVALLGLAAGLVSMSSEAVTLSADQQNGLRSESAGLQLQAAARAGNWAAVHSAMEQIEGGQGPRDARHELAALQVAQALAEAPMTPAGQQWLTEVATWPPLAMETLPDAGRAVAVPVFPVSAAARATLRIWRAREAVGRLEGAMTSGAGAVAVELTPQLLSRLTLAQRRAWADVLPRPLPANWALDQFRVNPGSATLEEWLEAEWRAGPQGSATQRLLGFRQVLATGDADLFDQTADAMRRSGHLRPAWLQALASDSGARSLAELQHWAADTHHGLDAALGLARRADGRRWLRTQLDDPAVPHMQLRRMVIALVEHGDASALRSWAQTQTHAAGLAQEVLVWLGE